MLDTTDPEQILAGVPGNLATAVVVVGSKSGSTVETASQKALFTQLFTAAGLAATEHMVIVTDPGSPLDISARADSFTVVNADPNVGGRYSALSAFGLVPAALIGVDTSELLDDAAALLETLSFNNSVAIELAAALFDAGEQCVAFADYNSNVPGLSDWIEQLIAESTGKSQKGRLPVVLESESAKTAGPGLLVTFAPSAIADLVVEATLGEHFILWEYVTALLSYLLEVDPFNQPNVTEAKDRYRLHHLRFTLLHLLRPLLVNSKSFSQLRHTTSPRWLICIVAQMMQSLRFDHSLQRRVVGRAHLVGVLDFCTPLVSFIRVGS